MPTRPEPEHTPSQDPPHGPAEARSRYWARVLGLLAAVVLTVCFGYLLLVLLRLESWV